MSHWPEHVSPAPAFPALAAAKQSHPLSLHHSHHLSHDKLSALAHIEPNDSHYGGLRK